MIDSDIAPANGCRELSSANYLQLMEFDDVDWQTVYLVDGLHYVGLCFAGQSEDEVQAYRDIALCSEVYGQNGIGPCVATVYEPKGGVVGSLGAVFNHYEM